MHRHLADHEQPQQEESVAHMLRVAGQGRKAPWAVLHQKPSDGFGADRSLVEFARIERGQTA